MNILDTRAIAKILKSIIFFAFSLISTSSLQAKCVLPVVDGTDEIVSNRNIAGFFISTKDGTLLIKEYKTGRIEHVNILGLRVAYSAYGGDLEIENIRHGVPIRIWYKNCKKPINKKPIAAYIEFFSNDLSDKPPKNYFSANGQ